MDGRIWDDCLLLEGEDSIKEYFNNFENSLLIIGKGFDPRQCRLLKKTKDVFRNITVCLVNYDETSTVPNDMRNMIRSEKNYKDLQDLCTDLKYIELETPMYRGDWGKKLLVISESVRTSFKPDILREYLNIIIDISAMPRGVSFSIIKRMVDSKKKNQKIYIAVCENSQYDNKIKPVIVNDSAEFLPGFNTFSISMEQNNDETIWFPILGFQEEAINTVEDYLKPIEICPVVPFPSKDVRRGEDILRASGNLLFQEYAVERRNIIYVPESEPLLVYQKLFDTVMYYEQAFKGNTNMTYRYAFSAQSSKLIDLGLLLALMDLGKKEIKAGIVVTENRGYVVDEDYNEENESLYCLCLNDTIFDW